MPAPFPFEALLNFGYLSIMLLVGVTLRAKIGFFQRYLIPSCLTGGVLGLILIHLGLIPASVPLLETFAYHFFNISFISVGLTRDEEQADQAGRRKEYFKGSIWMALIQGVTFPLQAIIGGLFVIIYGWLGRKLFPTFGFFGPLGFNEGPGQALSMGKVWEGLGFENAASIGLTFATMGIAFALLVGVPLVNWGLRKGLATHGRKTLPPDLLSGLIPEHQQKEPAGHLTLHGANVDTLAFQAALIGLVYVLTYLLEIGLTPLLPPDVAATLWGFFFILGMVVAMIVRWVMKRFGAERLIDAGVQRRVTGWSVDFLIVSTVMAIKLVVVWAYIVPITVIGLIIGVLSTAVVVYLGRRLANYNLERMVAIFGVVTGTVSNGLLLLRIVDPEFKTPVAVEIGIMNVLVAPFILAGMVLVNAPVWWQWSVGLTVLVFVGLMSVALVLLKVFKLWGRPRF
ncbi:MAG: sodium/glutamate symporter [Thermodesulfobacteriota bacterium]